MKNRTTSIAIHIVSSIAFLLFPIISSPDFPDIGKTLSNPGGISEIATHLLLLIFFYLCYYLLIPKYYFRHQYVKFAGGIIVYILLMTILQRALHNDFFSRQERGGFPMDMPPPPHDGPGEPWRHHKGPPSHLFFLRILFLDYSFYLSIIVLFIAMLLKTNQRWRQLQEEKLETELSYLKAQINPHFLFNTLNSIYSLAIEKSDYTPTAVVKLSGLMRYIISESSKNFVSLQNELTYIQDYIELQKFRLGGTVQINYITEGSAAGKQIAPLLLITFVENAFKYGVNPEEISDIFISIILKDNHLSLMVANNKVSHQNHKDSSGLGLKNTKHRLEMLYPGQYSLDINDGLQKFIVELQITLK